MILYNISWYDMIYDIIGLKEINIIIFRCHPCHLHMKWDWHRDFVLPWFCCYPSVIYHSEPLVRHSHFLQFRTSQDATGQNWLIAAMRLGNVVNLHLLYFMNTGICINWSNRGTLKRCRFRLIWISRPDENVLKIWNCMLPRRKIL